MKRLSTILSGLAILLAAAGTFLVTNVAHASAGAFTCSANFYQIIGNQLKILNPADGTYTNIGSAGSANINGIAYNTVDNYIYGFYNSGANSGDFVRIASDGTVTDLGTISGLPVSGYNNAAADQAGNMYVQGSTTTIYKINVAAKTATTITVGGTAMKSGADLAFINNKLYIATTGYLSVVNLTTNTNANATISALVSGTYGAAWNDTNNQLFVFNNTTGDTYQITNYDTASPTAVLKINGPTTGGNDGANCSQASAPILGAGENVSIDISHSGNFTRGSTGQFNITVANNPASGTANGLFTVTDTLPAGLTPSSATGTGWTCSVSGQTVTCSITTSVAGGSSLPAITLNVNVDSNASTPLSTTANLAFSDNTNSSPTDTDAVTVVGTNIGVDVSHTGNFTRGSTGSYVIAVANTTSGTSATGLFTVTDTLPAGLTPTTASGTGWSCSISGQTVTCTQTATVAGGASLNDISVGVSVAANAASSLSNPASIAFTGNINSTPNDTDPTTIIGQNVSVDVAHTGNYTKGGTGQFTISTTNNTSVASASGPFTITDTLPAGLTPTAASGTGWTCIISGQTITCINNNSLAGGASLADITATVAVASNAANSLSNTASLVVANNINSTPSDTDPVTTVGAGISINASHTGDFTRGAAGAFALTVANTSGAIATGLFTVTDTLPAGLTPTAASGTGWACTVSGQLVTCTNTTTLSGGASLSPITLAVQIANDAANTVNNTGAITYAGNTNSNPTSTDVVNVISDNDGVTASTEDAAPNGGDANNDGTPDSQQPKVTSLVDPISHAYAVLDNTGCTTNQNVSISDISAKDGSYGYPAGLMDFKLICATGATATVNMYFYGMDSANGLVMRKYDPNTKTYSTIPGATLSLVTIGGQKAVKASYQITDGGSLDQDGTANGTIVDPAGPAVLGTSVVNTSQLTDTGVNITLTSILAVTTTASALFVWRRKPAIT